MKRVTPKIGTDWKQTGALVPQW